MFSELGGREWGGGGRLQRHFQLVGQLHEPAQLGLGLCCRTLGICLAFASLRFLGCKVVTETSQL